MDTGQAGSTFLNVPRACAPERCILTFSKVHFYDTRPPVSDVIVVFRLETLI